MDAKDYDRRDAVPPCVAFVGFTFLASWTVWSALWAPGADRWSFLPGVMMALGWWAPAAVARVTVALFRPRRGPEWQPPEKDLAPLYDYPLATALVLACVAATVAFAFAVGACRWQWTWLPTGHPVLFGGRVAAATIDIYDSLNTLALWAQTAVVEAAYWLGVLIAVSGAEIGWRGMLLPRLLRAGLRPWLAAVIAGGLFGVWMWPLVWRGDVTGFYPGAPGWSMLASVACGTAWGSLLGWLFLRRGRLGPTVIAATWVAWSALVLPLVSSPYNALIYADPRSASASLIVGTVAALLWWLAPPKGETGASRHIVKAEEVMSDE